MIKLDLRHFAFIALIFAVISPPRPVAAQSKPAPSEGLVPVAIFDGVNQAGFMPKSNSVVLVSGTSGRVSEVTASGQEKVSASFQVPVGTEASFIDRTGQFGFIGGLKSEGALAGSLALPSGQILSSIPNTLLWSQYPSETPSPYNHQVVAFSSEANLALTWLYSKDGVSRILGLVDGRTSQVLQTLGTSIGDGSIKHAALSQSGQRLALVQNFQGRREWALVTVFDLTNGRTLARQEFLRAARPRFSPDDQALVLEGARSEQDLRRQVLFWKLGAKGGAQIWLPVAPSLEGVAFAQEGNQVVIADGTSLSAWSTLDGTEFWRVPLQDYASLVASASGDRVMTLGRNTTVLWGRGSLNEILSNAAADRSGERSYFASRVFANGLGLPKDAERAEALLNNSVALGHKPAIQVAIRRIESDYRNGDPISCSTVLDLYNKAKRAALNVSVRGVFSQCGLKPQK